jgi:hypothetical protein
MADIDQFIEVQSRLPGSVVARVTVTLDVANNRLVLTDNTAGAGAFSVTPLDGSPAASQLGLTAAAAGGTINGTALGAFVAATNLNLVVNAAGNPGIQRGSAARAPMDVLLVGGQAGIFRTFNPVGNPSRLGAYPLLPAARQVDVRLPGNNNDLQFAAQAPGLNLSSLQVRITNRAPAAQDSVAYDAANNVIEFRIPLSGRSANALAAQRGHRQRQRHPQRQRLHRHPLPGRPTTRRPYPPARQQQ